MARCFSGKRKLNIIAMGIHEIYSTTLALPKLILIK
jgi:hypothetical protein